MEQRLRQRSRAVGVDTGSALLLQGVSIPFPPLWSPSDFLIFTIREKGARPEGTRGAV